MWFKPLLMEIWILCCKNIKFSICAIYCKTCSKFCIYLISFPLRHCMFGPKGPVGVPNDPCQDDWRIIRPNLVRFFDHPTPGSLSWYISLFMYSFSLPAAYDHSPSYIIIHLHPLSYIQVRPKGGKTNIESMNQSIHNGNCLYWEPLSWKV